MPKTILGVFAHPDDESMGPGGTFAKYAAAGHRVVFVTATDGGAGRLYTERPDDNTELRRLRREETVKAAAILGAQSLGFLDWDDGKLHELNTLDVEVEVAKIIRREKPDVVIAFHGSGISYHNDHRVMTMAALAAFYGAARKEWYRDETVDALPPHQASKFYYYTVSREWVEVLNWPRVIYASPKDEISTVIDTTATADTKWAAIQAHDTQRDGPPFKMLYNGGVFEREFFVRLHPSWRGGDAVEDDLLAGLD